MVAERYWIETLGCPKNQVDSDKLIGTLVTDGFEAAESPEEAELVVVNTCAFIEAARQESIDTVLALADARKAGARLVVTGCMAERYGTELADALPEVDLVAPFGASLTSPRRGALPIPDQRRGAAPISAAPTAVSLGRKPPVLDTTTTVPSFDLLNLPRPPAAAPWSYVKIAEGCDRNCGFCAIPSFRGKQRSRTFDSILAEVDRLGGPDRTLAEVILIAQDLSSFALDRSGGRGEPRLDGPTVESHRPIVDLVAAVTERVRWTRLLYLYPSTLDDALVEAILATGVPYFDLSLQHVSRPLLKRMRRWGEGDRFLERIATIRAAEPTAAFRSSFIVGYPGETEADQDRLLQWIVEAQLDWVGFFPFSNEAGTYASELDGHVPSELVAERVGECSELQDAITAHRRDALVGAIVEVLVDAPGVGRTYREAPEIDGIVTVPEDLPVGSFADVVVTGADGPDLVADVADLADGAAATPSSPRRPVASGAIR
jgi:ribosomal protein S12 methylthiotransferase